MEEQLPDKKRNKFEEHLVSCEECFRVVSEFQSVISLIDKKKVVEPSPFLRTRILQKIESHLEKVRNETTPSLWKIFQPLSYSFIFIIAIVIGFTIGRQHGTSFSDVKNAQSELQSLKSDLNIPDFIDEDKMLTDNH